MGTKGLVEVMKAATKLVKAITKALEAAKPWALPVTILLTMCGLPPF